MTSTPHDFFKHLYRDTVGYVATSGEIDGVWHDRLTVNATNGDYTMTLHPGEAQRWFRVQPQTDPDGKRNEANTAAVVTLIADFDFVESSGSKGRQPFADLADVQRFTETHVPLPPSAVVASGHGIHAYWFLEPATPDEGKPLLVRFDRYLRDRAHGAGKNLDAMNDLARVLRIPGTVNAKHPEAPVDVELLELHPSRIYTIDDFDWVPKPKPALAPEHKPETGEPLDMGALPEWLQNKIATEDGNGDRSKAQVFLVHACLGAGLTVDQTWQAVHLNPAVVDKWRNRTDWRRQFDKIVDSHDYGGTVAVGTATEPPHTKARFEKGGVVFDTPNMPDSRWGDFERSLWAIGEPFMLYGPTGLGKTTIAQQVALSAIGAGPSTVLGYTVKQLTGNVLYIAADRPAQAKRSLRRMVTPDQRELLDTRWVWETKRTVRITPDLPGLLLQAAVEVEAEMVIIDSVKDVMAGISKDEGGQAFNDAVQDCVVNGIDVLSLHHPRKSTGTDERKTLTLDDVYGSTWLTAGQGSIVSINGTAGSGIARLEHLKQPADQVAAFDVNYDYETGTVATIGARDVVTYLQSRNGMHATIAEVVTHMTGKQAFTDAERKAVERQLKRAAKDGTVTAHRSAANKPNLWAATSDGNQLIISPNTAQKSVGQSVGQGSLDNPLDTGGHDLADPF